MTSDSFKKRGYKQSSSFKVATLFAILLTVAVFSLIIFIILFIQQSRQQEVNSLLIILGVLSIISLMAIAILGYLISVFVVTRINRIAETAQEIITTGDLTKRIEIDSRWDDLSYLGDVLNEMLGKIETLMQGVQHITDTIAHDLRTPLAKLRNKLEHTSIKASDESENSLDNREALVKDVDGLLKTFNSLLSLSSLEAGRQSLKFENFDLEKVVLDAVDFYLPLAEAKQQKISIQTKKIDYKGDRDLFFQVIANLIDNAIKFTQEHGEIFITMQDSEDIRSIIISDNGPGIPKDSMQKAFDRFYRDHRQQHIEGSGLGLSLVSAVLKLHKASIQLVDNSPGTKVVIKL
ncbi:MAG: HAMP domain-containing sensor histidine kinase [Pseudomonadota bacterium]